MIPMYKMLCLWVKSQRGTKRKLTDWRMRTVARRLWCRLQCSEIFFVVLRYVLVHFEYAAV